MDDLTPRDQIADRLRRADVTLCRSNADGLLPWQQLAESEQRRWWAMADAAYAAVTAVADVDRLATPAGPR